ncbi:MAG: hypothetical protein ABEJ44_07260 [Halanaeroarchaeum sp.]
MPRDARLDDFEKAGKESASDPPTASDETDASAAETKADSDASAAESGVPGAERERATAEASPDRAAVSGVVPTTAWTPEGAACADCGAVVERRWHQGGEYVCHDCKTWTDSEGGERDD